MTRLSFLKKLSYSYKVSYFCKKKQTIFLPVYLQLFVDEYVFVLEYHEYITIEK